MANIKSAIKRVKTTQAATERNIAQKNAMRTAIKAAETAKENNAENVEELVNKAISLVDKASNKNLLHKNKASRLKSKLAK
ncbi:MULTISPECIES: 30S ribosomal protein S20 [Nosocomiicoccus]|uniref:Small ribosomal subunit protein bS20 n=1 Tax=Nosocomiicoccus massiliensis TaxID=1232430 RepID=A0AAF1BT06_9STAP|nr:MULTISPECIES: 30S ribosomal protein S20 [Nosocomiicoccus]MDK6862578.1 30S ribosomal protein S20 [Nosocomiicoccus ampullae]OFL47115.1 30S ribosomal protein S20 [Nosocomiicoccus sp. HMSC067E10]OFO51398.1 30S ribosomal protein S20 [Nosocomiicoccus sp. HMSC059G07]OFS64137.1 30S ribosomal protein S20 [Nosocomiicoccus sp. HMSC09A07]WOS96427.1 30S ribosomal protein S20 [Nosocomiicoccus massiliensis]